MTPLLSRMPSSPTYLELIQLRSVQDAILVGVTELEYPPKGGYTVLLEDLEEPHHVSPNVKHHECGRTDVITAVI